MTDLKHSNSNEIPIRCGKVAVVVLRYSGKEAKILLMRRAKSFLAGEWCQVTGMVESGETHWQAATREVIEETGIQPIRLYSAGLCDFFYDPTTNTVEAVPLFVAIVHNDAEVALNHENTDYNWVNILEACDRVPFVGHRQALREINHDFIERSPMKWRLIKDYETNSQ